MMRVRAATSDIPKLLIVAPKQANVCEKRVENDSGTKLQDRLPFDSLVNFPGKGHKTKQQKTILHLVRSRPVFPLRRFLLANQKLAISRAYNFGNMINIALEKSTNL